MWYNSLQPVNYSNWATDEPNDAGKDEDCAVMGYKDDEGSGDHFTDDDVEWSGLWNDIPCDRVGAYALCESLQATTEQPEHIQLYTYIGGGFGGFVVLLLVAVVVTHFNRKKFNVTEDENAYDTYYIKKDNVEMKSSLDMYDSYYK